jgi:hypothetical protein
LAAASCTVLVVSFSNLTDMVASCYGTSRSRARVYVVRSAVVGDVSS